MYPTRHHRGSPERRATGGEGMNTAVTAMNGMSGRKKICQRSSPPTSARNVTMMSTVAAHAVTNSSGLPKALPGRMVSMSAMLIPKGHAEEKSTNGKRSTKRAWLMSSGWKMSWRLSKSRLTWRRSTSSRAISARNERALPRLPREGDLMQHQTVDAESDGDGECSVDDDGG